jgi:hypothetical protein
MSATAGGAGISAQHVTRVEQGSRLMYEATCVDGHQKIMELLQGCEGSDPAPLLLCRAA